MKNCTTKVRKTVFLLLVLTMVMTLSASTFATIIGKGETDSTTVTGTYKGQAAESPVYGVDISWAGLDFTYNAAYAGKWNPETHAYEGSTKASWEGTTTITITNHSNADITATPSYTAAAGYETASMTFDTDALTLTSADTGEGATTGTITATPTGSLPEGTTNATIGTITVTID